MVDLQIPSPYFWNFLQVFCKSILTTKSISSRTEKLTGEIEQDFKTSRKPHAKTTKDPRFNVSP